MKKGDLKKFALEHLYMNDKQVSCCYVTRMRIINTANETQTRRMESKWQKWTKKIFSYIQLIFILFYIKVFLFVKL